MIHTQEDFAKSDALSDNQSANDNEEFRVEPLMPIDEKAAVHLIRSNLAGFPEAGAVLAATFRRIENLPLYYNAEGAKFFIVKSPSSGCCVGAVGIGPMAGLPVSEGVGEIRDLVVDETFRGRGLGRKLLSRCLAEAKALGYSRIYLETTPQMEKARRLFASIGFVAVQQKSSPRSTEPGEMQFPCYFVLDLMIQRPEDLED